MDSVSSNKIPGDFHEINLTVSKDEQTAPTVYSQGALSEAEMKSQFEGVAKKIIEQLGSKGGEATSNVLNEVLNLVNEMARALQKVTISQAQRLEFATHMNALYTKVRGEIKHVTPEELYLEEENKKKASRVFLKMIKKNKRIKFKKI